MKPHVGAGKILSGFFYHEERIGVPQTSMVKPLSTGLREGGIKLSLIF
jgi:hypothetical protein